MVERQRSGWSELKQLRRRCNFLKEQAWQAADRNRSRNVRRNSSAKRSSKRSLQSGWSADFKRKRQLVPKCGSRMRVRLTTLCHRTNERIWKEQLWHFVLTEIRTFDNVRRYYFDVVAEDRSRRQVTVGADLDLIRRFRMPLQELPLLCRRLLEVHAEIETTMFTESDMQHCASDRTAEAKPCCRSVRRVVPRFLIASDRAWRGALPPREDR